MVEFTCNICGASNRCAREQLTREESTCSACGSNVRTRSLMWLLSLELFGTALMVPDFPRIKSLRGLGMTDWNEYARRLGEKFDYRNTFYNREPKFDITNPAPEEFGRYDFVISSEIFEHVLPPCERAFENAHRLLKPGGVLILTVPYSLEASMLEHYPEIHEFGFAQVGGETVLVNRTKSGELQLFEKPVFHGHDAGKALEMREYTEADVKRMLADAGFATARIYAENYPAYGIVYPEKWSLPVVARKGDFAFSVDSARAVMEEWRELRDRVATEKERLSRSNWFRLGRKLGWY
jgi:SAM-dependent methyltransferase